MLGKYIGFQGGNKASRTFVASLYFSIEQPRNFWDHQVVDMTSLFRDGFAYLWPHMC